MWLCKYERYFNLYRAFPGWYSGDLVSSVLSVGVIGWVEFNEELCNRFVVELLEDAEEEFNKLTQTGIVDECLGRFEELKAQMFLRNPTLTEAHFLSCFMGASQGCY